MTILPSFQNIENFSALVEENELFSQFSNRSLLHHYEANYIQLHFNPVLAEFSLLEEMYLEDLKQTGQSYLNFHWPQNTGLYMDVLDHLSKKGYKLGRLELLHLQPQHFTKRPANPTAKIVQVTDDTFEAFLSLNAAEDRKQSQGFAAHKASVYCYQYQCPHVTFLLAFVQQQAAGALTLIASPDYLEVDNVLTSAPWRKRGIATEMLAAIVKQAARLGKEVILLADAEDTPREMYLKLGFQPVASQIHALKKW